MVEIAQTLRWIARATRVGGRYRMALRNFTANQSHSFRGEHTELTLNQQLRYIARFADPNLTREIRVEVTLRAASVGTELNIEENGLPDLIPLELCDLGWQDSLQNFTKLVESVINQ